MSEPSFKPPRRFKILNRPPNVIPEHFLRYGTYFPTTDLCILDTGRRSTGEPTTEEVEWLDECTN